MSGCQKWELLHSHASIYFKDLEKTELLEVHTILIILNGLRILNVTFIWILFWNNLWLQGSVA